MTDIDIRRAGVVAVVGTPNAGKSTLINRLVGHKISIVTHKIQTTRFPISGITHRGDAQIVLNDTPGIFDPKSKFDRAVVESAWRTIGGADVVLQIIDAQGWVEIGDKNPATSLIMSVKDDLKIFKKFKEMKIKAYLALNKIDQFPHQQILPVIDRISKEEVHEEFFIISALNGDGVKKLKLELANRMPESPPLFPTDTVVNLGEKTLLAEITREKILQRYHREVPYMLTVETESIEEVSRKSGVLRVEQTITVENLRHKGIVVGKKGESLKTVRQEAGREMNRLYDRPVQLVIYVKNDRNWRDKREYYERLGLELPKT